jgi:hypothetical protein
MPAFRPANAVRTRARSEARSVRNDRWRKDPIRKREVAKRLRVALAPKWDQEFESAFLQRRVNNEPCGCRGIARRCAALQHPCAPWLTDPVTGVAVTVATFKPMAKHPLSTGMMAA